MSSFDVGTAFVRVLPDTREFQAALQAQVNQAVSQVQLPNAAGTTVANQAAATRALSTSVVSASKAQIQFAGVTDIAADATAREASATLALNRALLAEATAQAKAAGATLAGAEAAKIAIASQATQVAQLRKAEAGVGSLATRNQVLQGSLIGISRISPVAVFGLGVYGSAAIAAGLAVKGSVSAAADLEQKLNTLQAVSGATGDQMQQIADRARELGSDITLPGQSALDAAVGMTALAKAGLNVTDTLAASRGVLQLATAAGIDVGQAAEIAATQLNAFQLSGDQATRVAELLADASISAQGEMTDFAAAFQQTSAVAQQVGLSIEDTTALLTQLAKAGLQGADGGTSLRTTLLRLVPTTKEARQYVEALGIQIDKNKSIGEQIVPVIEQYRAALLDLTPVQQQQVLTQIFGQDAIRAASIIFDQQAGALRRLTAEFENQNSLQDLTDAKTKGLKGAFANLQSQTETLGTELGSLVTGPLADFANDAADTVGVVGDLVGGVKDLKDAFIDLEENIPFADSGGEGGLRGAFGKLFGTNIVEFGRQFGDVIEVFNRGEFVKFGETGSEALARINAEAAATKFTLEGLNIAATATKNVFGGLDFTAPRNLVDEDTQAAARAGAAAPLTEAQRRRRAAIEALNKQKEQKALEQIPIPLALQQAQIDAQLAGNLQLELGADNKIIDFIKKRLSNLKEGTQKFTTVSAQLLQAQKERDSVLSEIDSNEKSAAADRQKALDDAQAALRTSIQNTQTRLQIAADAAGANSSAERNLIAFLTREASDARLTTAEQLSFAKLLQGEKNKQTEAITRIAEAEVARRKALLDLAIQRDETLDPTNKAKLNSDIQKEIDFLREQQDDTKRLSAEWIDLESQIIALQGRMKDSPATSGFTLNDLFQEAVENFRTFGSNISDRNGILSPQDARASFGLTAGKNALEQIQTSQLSEAEKQTAYLASIDAKLSGAPMTPVGKRSVVSKAGNLGGWRAAQEAADNLYGAN